MAGLSSSTFTLALLCLLTQWGLVRAKNSSIPQATGILEYGGMAAPPYMVDNTHNYYHVAPDKGSQRGPIWPYSGSLEKYLSNLAVDKVIRGGFDGVTGTITTTINNLGSIGHRRTTAGLPRKRDDSYWMSTLGPLGAQPLAGNGYQFYRDVTDFGADNTGASDASEAINAAVSSWSKSSAGGSQTRCGEQCGNTFTQGAIVYFPPGTYKICSPVIQYYYTQFIGDANNRPTIKGCDTFKGIALFDTDPYVPGGSGSEWYVNQNQFFRQIRNFIFDLTDMPEATDDDDQPLVPTGIHWQVAQATSLQNLDFNMPSDDSTTAVGIFMENGSGGFVSDLTFNNGNIGWRAGSQQYTARALKFNNCRTAIQMVWSWGFNWQGITIDGGKIGLNISGVGGLDSQGIGSMSLIDSTIKNVNVGILTNNLGTSPNIVLDNSIFTNVANTIQVANGDTILSSSPKLWATGVRYNGATGGPQTGDVTAPSKAASLLDKNGNLFVRSRPQYETAGADNFLIATKDGGCQNDATGDQAGCINAFLQKAVAASKIAFFPAGIYRVGSTVLIPTGSVVQGSSWSQIMGAGYYFSDINSPKVMVQVGNRGEIGNMEIVEMLFTVQGNTAGAILMEWNVAASSQGAAGMWDSHFRVGGALGTDLDFATCPKNSDNEQCIAATLMFRVTSQGSGYFENVWAWVADHDNDKSIVDAPDSTSTQLAVFGARGMLIESQGPSWFLGTGSEHSVFYNYQLSGAKSIYMGHIQTESPYFQPLPAAPAPFDAASSFPNDPDYSQCSLTPDETTDLCHYAWGLRVVDSTDVYIHSAGLYSFFNDFFQDCLDTKNCQDKILQVTGSTGVVIFNLFTVAIVNPANGIDGTKLLQSNTQRGFTTEISVWIPLPGFDDSDIVYVGTTVFSAPTVSCSSSCILVFPTSALSTPSVISIDSYTTSFEYGSLSTTTTNGAPQIIFVTSTTTVTISVPSITISGLPFSNVNVSSTDPTQITIYPSVDVPPVTVTLPNGSGSSTPRVITLPPWPLISQGPGGTGIITDPESASASNGLSSTTTYHTPLVSTITAAGATVTTVTFPPTASAITISCPAATAVTFATPSATVSTTCTDSASSTFSFACPTTKVVTFLGPTTGTVTVDCTLVTAWSSNGGSSSSTTTPLPIFTTFPQYGVITPVSTTVSSPQPTESGVIVPCKTWFFFICISGYGSWDWVLPPGIYGPGPPPISIIDFPPGFTIEGNLPPWPRITIGNDGQLTTDSEPECETQSASICSTTTTEFVSTQPNGVVTTNSATVTRECETITGCSVRGEDYSTTTVSETGTQFLAPVGTWMSDDWPSTDDSDAYSSSVFNDLMSDLSAFHATESGTVISFTSGPTPGPTCAGGTACGGHLCTGYYCTPSPTGYPPGYLAPNDPSSMGYMASTKSIGAGGVPTSSSSTSVPSTQPSTGPSTWPPPPPNCKQPGEDAYTIQLFSDTNCQNPISNGNICVKGGTCYNALKVGWSSMAVTGKATGLGGLLQVYNRNACAAKSYSGFDQDPKIDECLTGFGFVANAVGLGSPA